MTTSTREILLEAARAELSEKGWSATGLGIRNRAKKSQGSWAHAFPGGKEQAAQEIYSALHVDLWREVVEALEIDFGTSARVALLKAMKAFLASVGRQPDRWRLLFELEHGLSQCGLNTHPTPELQRLRVKIELWAHAHMRPPKRYLPNLLVYPIVFGPALTAAHGWLADPKDDEPVEWAIVLTEAAIATMGEVAYPRAKLSGDLQRSANKDSRRVQGEWQTSLLIDQDR